MTIVEYELVPCCICGGKAEMVADEHGYSIWHDCINMSTRGVANEAAPAVSAQAWLEMNQQ